ncbi:MAG: helix-turn-helix domain-containing protein [Limisphaerales bacterium]
MRWKVSLFARSGLSRATISGLEGGPSNPTLESLLRIASVLDLPLSQILARAEAAVRRGKR